MCQTLFQGFCKHEVIYSLQQVWVRFYYHYHFTDEKIKGTEQLGQSHTIRSRARLFLRPSNEAQVLNSYTPGLIQSSKQISMEGIDLDKPSNFVFSDLCPVTLTQKEPQNSQWCLSNGQGPWAWQDQLLSSHFFNQDSSALICFI